MLEKAPSSFAPSTTTTLRASFRSSDSGSGKHKGKHRRMTLMIWSMGGRVVDKEGCRGSLEKESQFGGVNISEEVGNIGEVNENSLNLSFGSESLHKHTHTHKHIYHKQF